MRTILRAFRDFVALVSGSAAKDNEGFIAIGGAALAVLNVTFRFSWNRKLNRLLFQVAYM
jgi:hypothetical protein